VTLESSQLAVRGNREKPLWRAASPSRAANTSRSTTSPHWLPPKTDPVAFIRGLDRAVIDEVQRAPDLLLAIKQSVDEDRRPGRFLLTGSANLLTVKTIHESLAGRVKIVPLYPLGRSEQLGIKHPQFIAKAFRGAVPDTAEDLSKEKLSDWVTAGGYPEAIKRRSERRRQDWYRAYIKSILERDLPEISNLAKPDQVPRVLQIAAQFAGQLTNLSEIGRSVGLDHKTADPLCARTGAVLSHPTRSAVVSQRAVEASQDTEASLHRFGAVDRNAWVFPISLACRPNSIRCTA
jgi:AAA domain